MSEKTRLSFLSLMIYLFVFILMVEWLKPVIELTDTDHLNLFCLFLALSFLFYLVKLNWKIAIPLKILFIWWILVSIYTEVSFFSRDSFSFLFDTTIVNIKALIAQEWLAVTDSFRTLLFFILLWMTTYLLNYWIRVRQNLLLFFALTVLFIAILDTFSPYNGERSIVIVLAVGFLLNGLLYAQKVINENKVQPFGKLLLTTVLSLFGLIAVSVGLAFVLPKAGPSWPDPVPFFTSSSTTHTGREGSGVGGIRKVGYGENDEHLGGAFFGDDTPVFYATVPREQYWKIETKDTYTSKGWIQSDTEAQISSYEKENPIALDISPGQEEELAVANILMRQEFPFVVQPYGLTSINSLEQVTLSLNATNQKISTFRGGDTVPLGSYEVSFREPTYSLQALRETTSESLNGLTTEFNRYLQLPETLPSRVRDLATSITENETSLYDKAKIIERYFRRNGFSYNQTLAAVPTGDTDYVDQFLFETKLGYCDNFSSSMVVMLRSIGIPSRWVKGFAAGEVDHKENNVPVYEVTNNNAHSWVEAYFPEIGWMPFEPTIGFSNSINIKYDLDITANDFDTPVPVQPPSSKDKPNTEKTELSKGFTDVMKSGLEWISNRKAAIIWSCVGLLLLSLTAYRYKRKWISKVLIPLYRIRKNDWYTFEKMYHQLLKQLSFYGLGKEQGQTLMDYAQQIDAYFGDKNMRNLTSVYEKGFYGGNREDINYKKMRESWENLINQLSG
ncbi:transglutaminase TgpA family protein [Psychrobacillus vulpis]|uniref:Transglutaminase n=1 Tax=Psychrobacillus vulpis TaxID=2325572 RepID=A0A544TQ86_9BACI|nr:transglutaminaseTgpA domain-containing protein [Psychrobacillus vulpis]TQR19628.1 transglutaminase [Psychrobacillus vulpis]